MDPQQQIIKSLRNIEKLLSRQKSLETLLERLVVSMDALRDSNQRIDQSMTRAWESYDQLGKRRRGRLTDSNGKT
jgi:hypothetical protein